jgi:hypothetical protein
VIPGIAVERCDDRAGNCGMGHSPDVHQGFTICHSAVGDACIRSCTMDMCVDSAEDEHVTKVDLGCLHG